MHFSGKCKAADEDSNGASAEEDRHDGEFAGAGAKPHRKRSKKKKSKATASRKGKKRGKLESIKVLPVELLGEVRAVSGLVAVCLSYRRTSV